MTLPNFTRLPLNGAFNVRDIGGYPVNDDKMTKWGVFIRSDSLSDINSNDKNILYKYGIRTVIDLRTIGEINVKNHPIIDDERFLYMNIPIIGEFNKVYDSMYIAIIDLFQANVRKVFEFISERVSCGGILFHCSHGKDRTGVIAVLLLLLAEVSVLDIVTNHMISSVYLRPVLDKLKSINPKISLDTMHSNPVEIELFINYLRQKYGSVYNYFNLIGVSEHILNKIKERFISKF